MPFSAMSATPVCSCKLRRTAYARPGHHKPGTSRLGDRRLYTHFDALEVGDFLNRLLAVHMPQALAAQSEHVRAFDLGRIQFPSSQR
jgi:hypothetical protein